MYFIQMKAYKILQSIKSWAYRPFKSALPLLLCLLIFAFLLFFSESFSFSDRPWSRGYPTSDYYLCLIRHCTAEQHNTLSYLSQCPSVSPVTIAHLIDMLLVAFFSFVYSSLRDFRYLLSGMFVEATVAFYSCLHMRYIVPEDMQIITEASTAILSICLITSC